MTAVHLLDRIRREFPGIKWKSYRYLTHGWDHEVIILDGRTVFRAPKDSRYRNELKREIQLLHYLKSRVRLGIPECDFVSRDQSLAGYNMLSGQELTAFRFRQLDTSEREAVAEQLAGFITAIHSTPRSVTRKFHVKSCNQQKLYTELVYNTRKLVLPRLSKEDVRLVGLYFAELRSALEQGFQSTLVHNDLSSEHILWDAKNGRVNVIDFSDRIVGDPAIDLAGIMEYGFGFTKHVFNMYRGRKDEHFLHRSKLYFQRVPLYLMQDSLRGFPCTFEQGYRMFEKRFKK